MHIYNCGIATIRRKQENVCHNIHTSFCWFFRCNSTRSERSHGCDVCDFCFILDEVFVVQPSTQTVAENSGDAIFNCTIYALGQHWYVSEGLSDSKKNQDRGIHETSMIIDDIRNLKTHLLFVPSRISNDGLEITCYIYTQKTLVSEVAIMRVQGQFRAICRRVTFVTFARLLVCLHCFRTTRCRDRFHRQLDQCRRHARHVRSANNICRVSDFTLHDRTHVV